MNFIKIVTLLLALSYCSNIIAQEFSLYHQTNETNSILLEEKGDMAFSSSLIVSETITAYSIQTGYRPLKYLNISAAYFRAFGQPTLNRKRKNSSYTLSVGTNYSLKWKGTVNYGKQSKKGIVTKEKGINFSLNIGYSLNNINSIGQEGFFFKSKVIQYNSFFAKAGFTHKYRWGKWGLFGAINFNKYNSLIYNGNWEKNDYISTVSNYFNRNKSIRVWSINFHNEFGKHMLKLIFGFNLVITDQYGQLSLKRGDNTSGQQIYLGTLIDLNMAGIRIKKRKNKTL